MTQTIFPNAYRAAALSGIVLVFFISTFVVSVQAGGLGISPASFCLQNMEIGKDTDLGIDLQVHNQSNQAQEYKVETMKPAKDKAAKLGYDLIPDPAWLYFATPTIKVKAQSQGKLRMHLNIPDDKKYNNQHWLVEVYISPTTSKMFKMGVSGIYLIETTSQKVTMVKPFGTLALAPSVIQLDNLKAGAKTKGTFTIYNNDKQAHTYTLTTAVFPPKPKLQISATPGYQWVESLDWVKPAVKSIKIAANSSAEATVDVTLPNGKSYRDEGWEAIVMVTPDQGQKRFIRVQLKNPKK